jgi:hypothetical protein
MGTWKSDQDDENDDGLERNLEEVEIYHRLADAVKNGTPIEIDAGDQEPLNHRKIECTMSDAGFIGTSAWNMQVVRAIPDALTHCSNKSYNTGRAKRYQIHNEVYHTEARWTHPNGKNVYALIYEIGGRETMMVSPRPIHFDWHISAGVYRQRPQDYLSVGMK